MTRRRIRDDVSQNEGVVVSDTQTVLLAGSTGMLGGRIAHHLLDRPATAVRLLVRSGGPTDPVKKEALARLEERGAVVVDGDVTDPASLDAATDGVDVVVSALQGGPDTIIDGQVALARAAQCNGARRILPSDFAADLFAAPPGQHPFFDWRRAADEAIAETGLEHVHVLNGAFLDGFAASLVDHETRTVTYWGTGDELIEATTVDDTARYTARAALDRDLSSGTFGIVGERLSSARGWPTPSSGSPGTVTPAAAWAPSTSSAPGSPTPAPAAPASRRGSATSTGCSWSPA
jgi:uncharacterized protein YbjT (DUF2867 family)